MILAVNNNILYQERMSEQFEIVSESSFHPTGQILSRKDAIEQKAWCRSTNVFVMNSKGEILCHQRSLNKERMPGVWSTHLGGHVSCGEGFDLNALKELEEEAGITVEAAQLIPWRTTRHDEARLWMRDYVVLVDSPLSAFTPQPGEVEQFQWLSIAEILKNEELQPELWCAGTHDISSEYEAMRAALVVAHNLGASFIPDEMHAWSPSFYVIPQAVSAA